ncbi:MAG TPA: hypothetical protein VHP99_11695, partial [Pyrinomonadaceae bacterium]|nr:hypothetical protein [Pyrinomonadaceae bacterium]
SGVEPPPSKNSRSLAFLSLRWSLACTTQTNIIRPHAEPPYLTLGIFCSVFDLIYIWLLVRMKPAANA